MNGAGSAERRLNNSLSTRKKQKQLPKLKCVLAQPFPRYLPKVETEDVKIICDIIVNKLKSHGGNDGNNYKNLGLKIGLKSCLRSLKSNHISFVLLSSDIKPFIVVTQIITYALTCNCPSPPPNILCLPNFNQFTKDVFKTESLALTCTRNKFPELEEYIKTKCLDFPMPENFLRYHNNPKKNKSIENKIPLLPQKKNINSTMIQKSPADSSEFFLIKTAEKCTRSFVPDNAKHLKPIKLSNEVEKWTGDYIPFSNNKKMDIDENFKINNLTLIKKDNISSSIPETIDIKTKKKSKIKQESKLTDGELLLAKYLEMKMNKIQGNPLKIKKKKLKKNKKNSK